jgi:hypothetical protein
MKPEIIELPDQAWIKMWNVLETDDLSGLISLLDDYPYLENWYPQGGKLLHWAIYNQNVDGSSPKIAKFLCERIDNINITGFGGRTPIMLACQSDNLEMVKYLIDKGAEVNVYDGNKDTALMFAARRRNHEIVKLLLENNANPHIVNRSKESALTFTKKDQFYYKDDILLKGILEESLQSFDYKEPICFENYEKVTTLDIPNTMVLFEDFVRNSIYKIESQEKIQVFGITASVFNGFIAIMLGTEKFNGNFKEVDNPYFDVLNFDEWKNAYKSYTRWKTIAYTNKETLSKYQAPPDYISKPLYHGLVYSMKKLKKEKVFSDFSTSTKIGVTMYDEKTYYAWKNWPTSII